MSYEVSNDVRDKVVKTLDGLFDHLDADDSADAAKAIIVVFMMKLALDLMNVTDEVLKAEGFKK